ncbi:hypothetical protein EJP67_16625 [Variovorax guangxiensis]|uniref:Phage tail protein n=1 Tax=Variovorax guangxiensis TaxID=1775474 RepID=A0A3S0XSX9_9BURK|nr:hypothetical protein [Variovorax guangxiensis]RUR68688.1 hypothetical protein EJP67_16625 [Variovorax guangxiensis]
MNHQKAGVLYRALSWSPDGRLLAEDPPRLNRVPMEGLNFLLGLAFKSVTQVPTWYIGLYEGDYTPDGSETAATIASLATECTAYTGSRKEFDEGAVSGGSVSNAASLSEFVFTADKTVMGAFMVSASAKGSTAGVLLSVVRFASPKVQANGSKLQIFAGPTATPTP